MEWARDMVERLRQAVNGEKDRIIAEYASMTGKSPSTLYRIASRHGYETGRQARCDRGSLKCGLTDEQIHFVSSLVQTSSREVKGAILPVEDALQIAVDSGIIEPGQVSVSRLQGILRERDMNAAALSAAAPCIRMRSLHPNHVHIFDASVCIQYYLKGGKRMQIMDERDFYKNKPDAFGKIKEKLIRMVLADHFSHTLFVKYYVAAGENQQITFDFLTSAWRGGYSERMPFHGVPKFVLMDAGAANIAKGILALLGRLDIEIPPALPHNARRQGSAEGAQNIVERHFESRLRFEPAHTVEELNAWALDWCTWWNGAKKHRRHGMTRTECWLTITAPQLRELPCDEILRDLYAEPEVERTVRADNTITFRSEIYRVKHIEGIRPGRKVLVILRPYHWPQVAVRYGDVDYLVDPVPTVAGGFDAHAAIIGQEYKAQPETTVQQARKVNENLAYGESKKKGAIPFDGTLQVFGHQAEKLGNLAPMPKRGTPLEIARATVQAISITEMISRLRQEVGRVDVGLNRQLRDAFGDSVEVRTAERVIAAIAAGEDWKDTAAEPGHRQAL